jgi:hypothetical protein
MLLADLSFAALVLLFECGEAPLTGGFPHLPVRLGLCVGCPRLLPACPEAPLLVGEQPLVPSQRRRRERIWVGSWLRLGELAGCEAGSGGFIASKLSRLPQRAATANSLSRSASCSPSAWVRRSASCACWWATCCWRANSRCCFSHSRRLRACSRSNSCVDTIAPLRCMPPNPDIKVRWTSPRWPDTVAMRPGLTVADGRGGAAVPTPVAAGSRWWSAGVVGCTRRSSGRRRRAPGRGCGSGSGRRVRP